MKSFFLEPSAWPSLETEMTHDFVFKGPEAKHMIKVTRCRVGDVVRLFDGVGREGTFTIEHLEKSQAMLRANNITRLDAPPSRVVVALGWAKSVRRGWLMEKAVELEAAGVWFWQADHSQGRVPDRVKDSWEGQLIAGAKQSGNPWLPELRTLPGGTDELVDAAKEFDQTFLLWEDQEYDDVLSVENLRATGKTLFVAGPEGGFSQAEFETLNNAGITPVSLGKRTLRWETAALLCLGLHFWAKQS